MASHSIPWAQNREYAEACRTQLRPGERNSYLIPPQRAGASPTDNTDFQIGSAAWNINNLPDVFYDLWPCPEWKAHKSSPRPPQKRDINGSLMFERYPRPGTNARPILDFPILRNINKISTEVNWIWLEIMMRLEPRLTWADIDMLMENVGSRASSTSAAFSNALNMKCERGRVKFCMVSWREKCKVGKNAPNKARDGVIGRLSPQQLAVRNGLGSTRGLTPGPDGQGNIVPVPPSRNPPAVNKNRHRQASAVGPPATPSGAEVSSRKRKIDKVETPNDSASRGDDLDVEAQSSSKRRRNEQDLSIGDRTRRVSSRSRERFPTSSSMGSHGAVMNAMLEAVDQHTAENLLPSSMEPFTTMSTHSSLAQQQVEQTQSSACMLEQLDAQSYAGPYGPSFNNLYPGLQQPTASIQSSFGHCEGANARMFKDNYDGSFFPTIGATSGNTSHQAKLPATLPHKAPYASPYESIDHRAPRSPFLSNVHGQKRPFEQIATEDSFTQKCPSNKRPRRDVVQAPWSGHEEENFDAAGGNALLEHETTATQSTADTIDRHTDGTLGLPFATSQAYASEGIDYPLQTSQFPFQGLQHYPAFGQTTGWQFPNPGEGASSQLPQAASGIQSLLEEIAQHFPVPEQINEWDSPNLEQGASDQPPQDGSSIRWPVEEDVHLQDQILHKEVESSGIAHDEQSSLFRALTGDPRSSPSPNDPIVGDDDSQHSVKAASPSESDASTAESSDEGQEDVAANDGLSEDGPTSSEGGIEATDLSANPIAPGLAAPPPEASEACPKRAHGLNYGNVETTATEWGSDPASWGPEWFDFVKMHDSEPICRMYCPYDYGYYVDG